MVDKEHTFAIAKQCSLLSISRGFYYYVPVGLSEQDLNIMEKIDILYTDDPTRGQRRLRGALKKQYRIKIGRQAIRGYMVILGITAIYPKKDLSKPNKKHKKYPYLLRGVKIERVNQVWSTDITYVRLKRGFVYLTAVIDWYSRYVLSWRLSTTLDRQFCIDVLNEALSKYGKPEIFGSSGNSVRNWG
jgi:putative transposase